MSCLWQAPGSVCVPGTCWAAGSTPGLVGVCVEGTHTGSFPFFRGRWVTPECALLFPIIRVLTGEGLGSRPPCAGDAALGPGGSYF